MGTVDEDVSVIVETWAREALLPGLGATSLDVDASVREPPPVDWALDDRRSRKRPLPTIALKMTRVAELDAHGFATAAGREVAEREHERLVDALQRGHSLGNRVRFSAVHLDHGVELRHDGDGPAYVGCVELRVLPA